MSLMKHNLTIPVAMEELMSLTVSDYRKGPETDYDPKHPGDIWVFKRQIRHTRFYIKLKIVTEGNEDIVKCIGFHEDGIV